jgi:hypothetical protein
MRRLLLILFALAFSSAALAQSSPNWSFGKVPTAAEWNAAFAGKQDFVGAIINIGTTSVSTTVDFNVGSTDTPLNVVFSPGHTRYMVTSASVSGASASLTSSTVGIFTAPGGTGVTIAANQAVTVSTSNESTANNMFQPALTNQNITSFTAPTLYVRVGTPQGSAANASVTVTYRLLP